MPTGLVHSNEPWSALAIGQETAWGTESGGPYYTVPLVVPGETLVLRRDQIAPPRVFGGTGAREAIEYGRKFAQGSFTVQGRYDAKWFNVLMAHAMFGEIVAQNTDVLGATITGETGNTHLYRPGATSIPFGLTIRVFKGGSTNSGTYMDVFTGCMITSFTVEQTGDQPPLWTFTFLGKTVTAGPIGASTIGLVGGAVPQKFRDLSTGAAFFKTGAGTPTALNISGYRLVYDRRLEVDAAFANAPDATTQPGATDLRQVTMEINSLLEQDYYNAGKPYNEFLAGTISKIDVYYESLIAVGNKKYGLRIELPAVGWDVGQASLSDPANPPTRFNATAIVGNFDVTGGLPGTVIGEAGTTGDMRIGVTLAVADEVTADTIFGVGWAT